jgi:halimadienyl-diphosphate synthase
MSDTIAKLIDEIGPGHMASTAYDTAWAARLGEVDRGLSIQALGWLSENQLPDGSWGTAVPFYYHDRVICTLAAMIALTYQGRRGHDKVQIDNGKLALERILGKATAGLPSDPNGATIGFEMIAPTLVQEAEKLGIIKDQSKRILGHLSRQRAMKLSYLKDNKISRHVTMAFSAEMAGTDGKHMLDIEELQESNGSVGLSPSATAYFATYIKRGDELALKYLHSVTKTDGGLPNAAPFDVFEIAWTLWNLSFIPDINQLPKLKPHLEFLSEAWQPQAGLGFAAGYSVKDGDGTGVAFDTLLRYGIEKDLDSVLMYEEKEHFRCFKLEANPSISANIHLLGALRQAGLNATTPSIRKIITFLRKTRGPDVPFWVDKWHFSPYYTTSHAIIACAGLENELVDKSVEWILKTQHKNGSWGIPTAEETAYALQALWVWNEKVARVPRAVFTSGAQWLKEHLDEAHPPLWIGKCLYSPRLVIRSAIVGALALVNL